MAPAVKALNPTTTDEITPFLKDLLFKPMVKPFNLRRFPPLYSGRVTFPLRVIFLWK
jgi:hypothetical protein